jgi:hypothetical protein
MHFCNYAPNRTEPPKERFPAATGFHPLPAFLFEKSGGKAASAGRGFRPPIL